MAKKYPTKKNTTFILGEDVRFELSKKMTVAGIYGGGFIRVHKAPSEKEPVGIRLMFVFVFGDGEGTFQAQVRVLDPEANLLVQFDPEVKSDKRPDAAMTIVCGALNMPVKKLGRYLAIVSLDDREYEYEFSIAYEEPPKS